MPSISFAKTTPFFFQGKTPFIITLNPELLKESDWFLNIDLFPKAAPSVKRRHYGQWVIPCEKLSQSDVQLVMDWETRTLMFTDRKGEDVPAVSNVFPLEEHGYYSESRYCDFGTLTQSTLREAWDSPQFVKFRDDVLHGRYPATCQGCYCLEYLVP
jgi:hypothetical protein